MRRLQAYALSKGFAVVNLTSKPQRAHFACIHHGSEARNWRGLEDHIEKDDEGTIMSRRKKDNTSSNAKNCTWEMYWSVRSVRKRGFNVIAGQLGITKDIHSHQFTPNSFIY